MSRNRSRTIISVLILVGAGTVGLIVATSPLLLDKITHTLYKSHILQTKPRTFCLNAPDEVRCITEYAVKKQDPYYCYFLDAGTSDVCADAVIESANDAEICKRIAETGRRNRCDKQLKKE